MVPNPWVRASLTNCNLNYILLPREVKGGVGMTQNKSEYDSVMSTYYGDDAVSAIITLKVDTKEADTIAEKVSEYQVVEDVFLVTGDTDIIAKVKFQTYDQLKKFLISKISNIDGIKDIKTLMVVTTFKERGEKRFEPIENGENE
jgi:Lrp/AsnC family leucine-responsive transcriptional regulator